MPSASKSTNLYSNNGGAYPLGVSFDETSTSTSNNTSTLSLNGYLQAVGEYWSTGYASTLTIGWHDNRRNEDMPAASISFYGMAERETKYISASITVTHKDDGSLSGYAYISFSKGQTTSWYAPNSGSVGTDLTALTNIARYPLITSAPNFTDEENPTVSYSTSLGFEDATTEISIEDSTGNTIYVPYRPVTIADGSYTFNLTNEERNTLRNATPNSNTMTVTFKLRTTAIDNVTYFSTMQKVLSIVNADPQIDSFTVEETNQDVIDVLGSATSQYIIPSISYLHASVVPSALKGSSIGSVSLTVGGATTIDTASPYSFDFSPSNTQSFIVADSRGNTTGVELLRTILPYMPVRIESFSFERYNPTSSNIILNLEATYLQYTYGSTANVPIVKWKLDNGNYVTIPSTNYTIDTANHKLTITNYELTNALVYTSNGTFTISIEDLFSSDSETQNVLKGIPTFDAGEHDLKVNGDLFIADTNGENKVNVLPLIKPKLLWTNSNPNVSFSGQQVTLSSDEYDMLEVFFYDYINTTRFNSVKIPKGEKSNMFSLFDYNSGMYMGRRTANNDGDTTVTISGCYSVITNSSINIQLSNEWMIPVYIVGYKTGLF